MASSKTRRDVGEVNLKYGDKVVTTKIAEITSKSEYKGVAKTSHYYTTPAIAELGVKPDEIRLYKNLGGAKGHQLTDEEAITLFEGGTVHAENLPKRKGGTYDADFEFDPTVTPSYLSKPIFKGETMFAKK